MEWKKCLAALCGAIVMFPAGSGAATADMVFRTGPDQCVVTACSDHVLKIDYRPYGRQSERTPVVDKTTWDYSAAEVSERDNEVVISTPFYRAVIGKMPFTAQVYDPSGRLLLSVRKPHQNNLIFTHDRNDNFYGLSGYNRDSYKEGHYSIMRNAGGIIEAQPQGGCGAPFIWSTSGYGIVLDTDGGNVSNTDGRLVFGGCSKENFEFYILVGNPRQIIAAAGEIAGMPPMFPKWNTGFGQLEWGIDEAEFKTHVQGYRDRKIPFDWFMIDFDWMAWGEDHYGEFRWGKGFPSGESGALKQWADSIGVKITAITKPRIIAKNADGSFTEQGRYAEEHGFWFPDEEFFPDYVSRLPSKDLQFAIPACREWWWKHLQQGAYEKGIRGYLNDECDDSNQGGLYNLGNFSNIFMQKSIYDGQRALTNQRVWSINRTAYMGSQKYAYSIWSGDNYPTFSDLRSQASKMLTANNVLVPVWGFCMTAFWNTVPVTDELYLRSMQLGLFSPLYFLHGIWGEQKQPWFFSDHVVEESRKIVELRYRLIPYIYAYDRIKHETMLGISRALVIDYPEDENVADLSETFLFGDYLLASPVLDSAAVSKTVYMPRGEWIGFFDGKRYEGGRNHVLKTDHTGFTDIPLFIKKGAIIPTQDVMAYVGERRPEVIYLDIFPSEESTSFPLYDDDGETYDYEKGHYFKQLISTQDAGDHVVVDFATQEGVSAPTFKTYIVRIHNRVGERLELNGKALKRCASYEDLVASKREGWCTGEDLYGHVTYVKTNVRPSGCKVVVTGSERID